MYFPVKWVFYISRGLSQLVNRWLFNEIIKVVSENGGFVITRYDKDKSILVMLTNLSSIIKYLNYQMILVPIWKSK